MFNYQIINPPTFEIDENILKEILFKIHNLVKKDQYGILNIVFVSGEEIQELNKSYREKDYVTDVLSFHYFEDFSMLKEDDVAGELIFCQDKIASQAIEYNLGETKEFYKLFIHSVLHILGYDHEDDDEYKIMQELEDGVWNKIIEKK